MTENLRLVFAGNYVGKYNSSTNTITATTTQITPANSDVSKTWLPGHTTETSATKTTWYSNGDAIANTPHSQISNRTFSTFDGESQIAGGYYNYYVVSASTGSHDFTSGVVDSTICAKGWTLPNPTYGPDTPMSLGGLFNYYGLYSQGSVEESVLNKVNSFPLGFIFSGARNEINVYGEGNMYRIPSSSVYTSGERRYVRFADGYISELLKYDSNGGIRLLGFTVRCRVK